MVSARRPGRDTIVPAEGTRRMEKVGQTRDMLGAGWRRGPFIGAPDPIDGSERQASREAPPIVPTSQRDMYREGGRSIRRINRATL